MDGSRGITSPCGCSELGDSPSAKTPVYVDQNNVLIAPTLGQFSAANRIFDYQPYTASSTSTLNLQMGSGQFMLTNFLTLNVGTGAYAFTVTLDYINAIKGALMNVRLAFPASTNPSVIIQDRASSTQLFDTYTSPGVVSFSTLGQFIWTGSAWQHVFQS